MGGKGREGVGGESGRGGGREGEGKTAYVMIKCQHALVLKRMKTYCVAGRRSGAAQKHGPAGATFKDTHIRNKCRCKAAAMCQPTRQAKLEVSSQSCHRSLVSVARRDLLKLHCLRRLVLLRLLRLPRPHLLHPPHRNF